MTKETATQPGLSGKVRPAVTGDIDKIYALTIPYVEQEILLPRSKQQISSDIHRTWVYESLEGDIWGTVTLVYFEPALCEVRALVVEPGKQGYKIGRSLILSLTEYIRQNAKEQTIRLFALTYVPDFFIKSGFSITDKSEFPQKIYEVCRFCSRQHDCKEIAVQKTIHLDPHHELEEGHTLSLDFDKLNSISNTGHKVVPVVVQDNLTKEILIVAYANQIALNYTLENKIAAFWSTSRNELWIKGKTSGNALKIVAVRVNCEQNSLLYLVEMQGKGSCHTLNSQRNHRLTCYYREIDENGHLKKIAGME